MIMTGVGSPPSKQAVTTMEQGRPENYEDGQLELDAEKSRFVTVAFVVVVIQKVQGVTTSPSGSLCSYSQIRRLFIIILRKYFGIGIDKCRLGICLNLNTCTATSGQEEGEWEVVDRPQLWFGLPD